MNPILVSKKKKQLKSELGNKSFSNLVNNLYESKLREKLSTLESFTLGDYIKDLFNCKDKGVPYLLGICKKIVHGRNLWDINNEDKYSSLTICADILLNILFNMNSIPLHSDLVVILKQVPDNSKIKQYISEQFHKHCQRFFQSISTAEEELSLFEVLISSPLASTVINQNVLLIYGFFTREVVQFTEYIRKNDTIQIREKMPVIETLLSLFISYSNKYSCEDYVRKEFIFAKEKGIDISLCRNDNNFTLIRNLCCILTDCVEILNSGIGSNDCIYGCGVAFSIAMKHILYGFNNSVDFITKELVTNFFFTISIDQKQESVLNYFVVLPSDITNHGNLSVNFTNLKPICQLAIYRGILIFFHT